MNGKRSYWKWLMAGAGIGMGLAVTNCTITTDGGTGGTGNVTANGGAGNASSGSCTAGTRINGCICLNDNHVSSQLCGNDGLYGACDCAVSSTGGATSTGGASSAAGANTAGAATGGYSGSGGYSGANTAGAGGASTCSSGISSADDCVDCLAKACATQWAACEAEDEGHVDPDTGDYCLKNNSQADDGQMDSILNCIAMEQGKPGTTVVKRDVVRACGSSIGTNPDPTTQFVWAPPTMTAATKNLMNCLADAPGAATPGAWADSNDPASFAQDPDGGLSTPLPWADCTCAKTSCTTPL
jgi:hypothetical protein